MNTSEDKERSNFFWILKMMNHMIGGYSAFWQVLLRLPFAKSCHISVILSSSGRPIFGELDALESGNTNNLSTKLLLRISLSPKVLQVKSHI